ncbi:MAG TPA: FHA domain-containing protein, partial [Tepidisphaeraceae bacterium]|nr:FHA domain-containing protein [Tepidisphaeraceae bacterium]
MAASTPVKLASNIGPALLPLGHHQGKPPIRITRPVYVVGSRANARLHLVSNSVSKAHALIVRSNSRTYIRDLASRNKVYINGDEVREAELVENDLIKIGTFTFQYIAGLG